MTWESYETMDLYLDLAFKLLPTVTTTNASPFDLHYAKHTHLQVGDVNKELPLDEMAEGHEDRIRLEAKQLLQHTKGKSQVKSR